MELVRFLMLYHGISALLACHLFLGSKSGAKIIKMNIIRIRSDKHKHALRTYLKIMIS